MFVRPVRELPTANALPEKSPAMTSKTLGNTLAATARESKDFRLNASSAATRVSRPSNC